VKWTWGKRSLYGTLVRNNVRFSYRKREEKVRFHFCWTTSLSNSINKPAYVTNTKSEQPSRRVRRAEWPLADVADYQLDVEIAPGRVRRRRRPGASSESTPLRPGARWGVDGDPGGWHRRGRPGRAGRRAPGGRSSRSWARGRARAGAGATKAPLGLSLRLRSRNWGFGENGFNFLYRVSINGDMAGNYRGPVYCMIAWKSLYEPGIEFFWQIYIFFLSFCLFFKYQFFKWFF